MVTYRWKNRRRMRKIQRRGLWWSLLNRRTRCSSIAQRWIFHGPVCSEAVILWCYYSSSALNVLLLYRIGDIVCLVNNVLIYTKLQINKIVMNFFQKKNCYEQRNLIVHMHLWYVVISYYALINLHTIFASKLLVIHADPNTKLVKRRTCQDLSAYWFKCCIYHVWFFLFTLTYLAHQPVFPWHNLVVRTCWFLKFSIKTNGTVVSRSKNQQKSKRLIWDETSLESVRFT